MPASRGAVPRRHRRRLARLTHRLAWVNPHAGKDGYAPVQSGIVAALPHLDELLAGHSLATLENLLEVMRFGDGRRWSGCRHA